jgi:hypothetical protein
MCRVRKANLNDMISDHGLDVVKIPGTEVSKVGIKVNRTAICLPRKKRFHGSAATRNTSGRSKWQASKSDNGRSTF